MIDLAEFLLDRIAEDEADARLAMVGFTTGEWTNDGTVYAGHEPARSSCVCDRSRWCTRGTRTTERSGDCD